MADTPDAPIRYAATLVLARDGERGIEVHLSRRTSRAAFMANAWVYPGGRVDKADADPAFLPHLLAPECGWDGLFAPRDDTLPTPAEPLVRAHVVAVLRESFEEAGVLFAQHADGRALDFEDRAFVDRLAGHRVALNKHERTFLNMLDAESLVLDARGLEYFAHWITPPHETRRYDTRFFFGTMPAGQEPVPDRAELIEGRWFRPLDAIAAAAAGQISLFPPTLCTLTDLAASPTVAAARSWADAADEVPILPQMFEEDGAMVLALPGDVLFPSARPVRGATRVVFRDGRFTLQDVRG